MPEFTVPEPEERHVPPMEKQPAERLMPFPKLVVAPPVTAKEVVVAPVKEALVAKRLVAVALVIVAFVERRLVIVPAVAERIEEKKLVEVDCVVVERRMLAKTFAPEKVLLSPRSVEDAAVVPMQVPNIEKQPPVRLIPFAAVLVALPVSASWRAESPPAKVLVPCPAATVIAPAKVEVAVEVDWIAPKRPVTAERTLVKKELVEVALVSVAFVAV